MNYVVRTWKKDRRTKLGEKVIHTTVVTEDTMLYIKQIDELNPNPEIRYEIYPEKKTVKNLMTGADVEIDYDTPRSCDPSSETYWSM